MIIARVFSSKKLGFALSIVWDAADVREDRREEGVCPNSKVSRAIDCKPKNATPRSSGHSTGAFSFESNTAAK
jgi:hypothetical protein